MFQQFLLKDVHKAQDNELIITRKMHTFPDLQSAAHCASASEGAYGTEKRNQNFYCIYR